jgi:hypothetical protein
MSPTAQFLVVLAVDLGGLVVIHFFLRARIRRQLELENLLSGVREEARSLVMELNETADRNVSLVEDRIVALRGLMDELDRRMGVARRELETRDKERDVFERLRRRRPIVPAGAMGAENPGPRAAETPRGEPPSGETDAAIPILRRPALDVRIAPETIVPARSKREEALELHRKGFSPDLIAARVGATVSEIELLVDIEQRRSAAAQ